MASTENAKHTPGPWRVVETKSAFQVRDHFAERICSIDTRRVRQEEDARLIASAPEMLEVLRKIAETPLHDEQAVYENKLAVIAAIAKAEGTPTHEPAEEG